MCRNLKNNLEIQKKFVPLLVKDNNNPLTPSNMNTYKLTATALKNGKTLYQVINENGEVISKRTSTRKYVACTIDGEFYFGRLDLIGKGDHGKMLNYIQEYKYNTTLEEYNTMVAKQVKETRLSHRMHLQTWLRYTSIEKQNAPMDDWMYGHLVKFFGKEVADTCKTQKDFQVATANEDKAVESLMERIGTFEDWKAWREARLEKLEPAMQVAYLAN